MTTKAEAFTPHVLEPGYGVVMVEIKPCAKCGRQTLAIENGWKCPAYWKAARAEQMRRAGWVDRAPVTDRMAQTLCVECAPDGAVFTCALCKQERHGAPEDVFGDPPEFLCVPCFETVTAKVWAAKEDELREAHRYDFE